MIENLYFNNKDLYRDFNGVILDDIAYPTVNEIINLQEMEGSEFGSIYSSIFILPSSLSSILYSKTFIIKSTIKSTPTIAIIST